MSLKISRQELNVISDFHGHAASRGNKAQQWCGLTGWGNTLKKGKLAEHQCELMMRLEREEEAKFWLHVLIAVDTCPILSCSPVLSRAIESCNKLLLFFHHYCFPVCLLVGLSSLFNTWVLRTCFTLIPALSLSSTYVFVSRPSFFPLPTSLIHSTLLLVLHPTLSLFPRFHFLDLHSL